MMRILTGAIAVLLLTSGAALAGHGKAGLWNVSTTMQMAMTMPPEALAQMKKAGVTMPTARTIDSQVCMTQAQVDSDKPQMMGRNDSGCETHVIRQTASSMTAAMTCNGQMKGSGQMQITYTGAEHYSGSYNFKGTAGGTPATMSSSFKGVWVKADCGSVKPDVSKSGPAR